MRFPGVLSLASIVVGLVLTAAGAPAIVGIPLVLLGTLAALSEMLATPSKLAGPSPTYGFDGPVDGAPVPFAYPLRLPSDPYCGFCGRPNPTGMATCEGCGAS